jgi:tRNA-specific 2-thiouridylase
VSFEKDRLRVAFVDAQEAVTPGQSVVFYDGDIVLGGGIIKEVFSATC